jgi:hypothetical protein
MPTKTTKRRAKPGTSVIVVTHNTGSEGIEVTPFGGADARLKSWAHIGGLIEDYLDNRNKLGPETTRTIRRALEKGKFKLAWSWWSTAQDEAAEVDFFDQESIDRDEKVVA